MEVEPAAEVSATGARQTCQCPGIDCDAADPADNTHHGLVDRPFKRGDPNRACGREAQTKAKTKYPGLCIAAEHEGSAHALVGRRDRARLERLSTANAGDKLGRSDRITDDTGTLKDAHNTYPSTLVSAHSSTVTSRNTPAHIRWRASTGVTTPEHNLCSSRGIFAGFQRGSNPLSSTFRTPKRPYSNPVERGRLDVAGLHCRWACKVTARGRG